MLKHMSIKKKIIVIFSVLFVMISGLLALNYMQIRVLEKNWDLYNTEAAKRLILIGEIKSEIGYGGFIHQFKNYVIRGQDKQIKNVNEDYKNFKKYINEYKNLKTLTIKEKNALNIIEKTIDNYYKNLQLAIKLRQNGKTIHQIDQQVKIDDGPAINAFKILLKEVNRIVTKYKTEFSKALMYANLHIIFLALMQISFIFVYIFILKTIIIPLNEFQKGLNNFFRYLNNENVTIEPLTPINDDEIGEMIQNTNIAIQSAIKTHDELIYLRNELEKQVEITTKDLNIITQNKQEALEYGSLIIKSLLPSSKELKEIFTNYIILTNKNNLNSQFYLIEQIKENEYLYVLIDTKEDDIKSIFTIILINAIIKQAITKIDLKEITPSVILEYLNQNIHISNNGNGFDGAIIYYNKSQNIIKYAGVNLALHYKKDNSFHVIKADTQPIGIDKSVKYNEYTIEIGKYIELFIATNGYIENYINIYNFNPFENKNNYFDDLYKLEKETIITCFQIDNKPKIIIEYEGDFTQELINKYMEIIEDNIENIGLMSNVSINFVEQFQNVLKYAKSKDISIKEIYPYGYIKLQKNPDGVYLIETKNILTLEDKQKIEPILLEIKTLNKNEIKKRYRELRKSGKNTHLKGGGIGFYEIAKRANNIEYEFTQLNEDRFEFRFISMI